MTRRLTPIEEVDIIKAFTVHLVSMEDLALKYDRTRQGIWKLLKRNGINPADYAMIKVSCTACGCEVVKHRYRLRIQRYVFCDQECYYAFIEGRQQGSYFGNRWGMKVARAIVSSHFELLPGYVVHHEDRNNSNNGVDNLRVFANNGDHVRYHRWSKDGVEVKPIWDGSRI